VSKSEHSPGPWKLVPISTKAGRNKLAVYGGGRRICEVRIYDDRDVADAHLITAAPELLKALTTMADLFEEVSRTFAGERWVYGASDLNAARAAIAVAKGSKL